MIYQGEHNLQALKDFVRPLMVQTMFEFTNEKVDTIFGGVKPALILFIDKEKHFGT